MKDYKKNALIRFFTSKGFLNTAFLCAVILPVSYTVFRIKYLAGKTFFGIVGFFLCTAVLSVIWAFIIKRSGGSDMFAKRLRDNKFSFLAMAITAIIMLFAFAVYQVVPFGDYTVLRMDLYHQYGPLFGELYDKIVSGESLLYSMRSGGGNNFLGNFFNYLSSPVALIIFWFKRAHLVDSIAYMILIKCAFSAGTFVYYLKKHYKKNSPTGVAFALLYSFSAYFIAYYWNLMWLDAMVLLPLVLIGIEQIINSRKMWIYTAALTLTFLTNYYMSYMVCIFSVMYFLVYYFSNFSLKDLYVPRSDDLPVSSKIIQSKFLGTGIRFAFASILSALFSAFALLPVYFALKSSSATGSSFPSDFELYFNVFDFIANHFASVDPTIRSSGDGVQPNVYCGVLTVMLIPLYLISKHIKARDKICHILLLAVFFVSFNTNFANFIWHGFHFPNDLPYRFSFIYSFILLTMAYKVFTNAEQFSNKILIGVGIGALSTVILIQKLGTNYSNDFSVYVSIAFIAVYTFILLAIVNKKIARNIIGVVMICASIVEVLIADVPRLNFAVTKDSYISKYDTYEQVLDSIAEMDDSAYRVEVSNVENLLRMSPCWYNYKGLNCFSSMEYEKSANLQFSLGMFGNKINSYTYYTQTPVYNSMFGLKYIIENDNKVKLNPKVYTQVLSKNDKLTTYENNYFLPLAFAVNSTLKNYWETDSPNPFEVQNDFVKEATGIKEDVFKPIPVDLGVSNNCYIAGFDSKYQNNFTVTDTETYANFTTGFNVPKDSNVYIYYGTRTLESIDVTTDSYNISQTIGVEPYILDLGMLKKGENVSINANIDDEQDEGWFYTYAYYFDEEVWEKAYSKLNDGGAMDIDTFTETKISGTVTVNSGEIIYTSLAFDEGWNAYCDGKKCETVAIADTLLGIKTEKGTHKITLKYEPKGLKAGTVISLATLIIVIAVYGAKWLIIRKISKIIDTM